MDLEAIGNIGEAVGGIAVVVSLVYLVLQIRQNTRSIRASTYQSIVAAAAACNRSISESRELARILRIGSEQPTDLDADEQVQFSFLCMQLFDLFENLFLQSVHGELDDDYWQSRRRSFLALFAAPGFADRWARYAENYSPAFRTHVDTALRSDGRARERLSLGFAEPSSSPSGAGTGLVP